MGRISSGRWGFFWLGIPTRSRRRRRGATFPKLSTGESTRFLNQEQETGVNGWSYLNDLPRRPTRGPGPLEVVAAKPAGHIHHFADEIKPLYIAAFHGLGGQLPGIHTALGDFSLRIAH